MIVAYRRSTACVRAWTQRIKQLRTQWRAGQCNTLEACLVDALGALRHTHAPLGVTALPWPSHDAQTPCSGAHAHTASAASSMPRQLDVATQPGGSCCDRDRDHHATTWLTASLSAVSAKAAGSTMQQLAQSSCDSCDRSHHLLQHCQQWSGPMHVQSAREHALPRHHSILNMVPATSKCMGVFIPGMATGGSSHSSACRLMHLFPASSASILRHMHTNSAAAASGHSSKQRPQGLKAALRSLYKSIHPDLFGDNKEAKEQNERSFKLLQDYLHLARTGDGRSPASRVLYRFTFYIRQSDPQGLPDEAQSVIRTDMRAGVSDAQSDQSDGEAAGAGGSAGGTGESWAESLRARISNVVGAAAAAGATAASSSTTTARPSSQQSASSQFRKVEVTLPPPTSHHRNLRGLDDVFGEGGLPTGGSAAKGPLPPGTGKALAKLLRACGIDVDEEDDPGKQGSRVGGPAAKRLSTFLPDALEKLRQAEAAGAEPAVRVANIRGAFRLQRQLMVGFQDASNVAPEKQAELLSQLAQVLDRLPDVDLRGCAVVMGPTLGIDRLGNLCLDIGPGHDTALWSAFLSGADLNFVRQRRQLVAAVKQMEVRVAKAVGLAGVFGSQPTQLAEPSYREFLERLAAAASEQGQVGGGAFSEVPLCVLPSYAFWAQQRAAAGKSGHAYSGHGHSSSSSSSSSSSNDESSSSASGSGGGSSSSNSSISPAGGRSDSSGSSSGSSGSSGQPRDPASHSHVDEALGVLNVPDELKGAEVYAAVQLQGPKVAAALRIKRHKEGQAAALVTRVRTALRLRRFWKDERLGDQDFKVACQALLAARDTLMPLLEGSSVRVSFGNRVSPGATHMDIAHDFTL